MVLAVVHVNATGPEVHLAAALLFEVNALGCLGITCIANATTLWRSRLFRSFRDDNPARATRFRAVGGLEGHVVFDGFVHVQKLIQRHAVELRQGNEVVGVGRRLGALPLGNGLARHAQLLRQGLLRQSRKPPARGQALGNFDIHGVLPFFCDCLSKTPWSLPKTSLPRNQFALSFSAIIGCGSAELGQYPSSHHTHGSIRAR